MRKVASNAHFFESVLQAKEKMYPNFQSHLKKGRHSQYLPMTRPESWAFIKNHFKMVLCSLDSDGFPHAAPIWFVVIDDRIYFRAQPYKKKIKNIMNRPQVCGVIEDGEKSHRIARRYG